VTQVSPLNIRRASSDAPLAAGPAPQSISLSGPGSSRRKFAGAARPDRDPRSRRTNLNVLGTVPVADPRAESRKAGRKIGAPWARPPHGRAGTHDPSPGHGSWACDSERTRPYHDFACRRPARHAAGCCLPQQPRRGPRLRGGRRSARWRRLGPGHGQWRPRSADRPGSRARARAQANLKASRAGAPVGNLRAVSRLGRDSDANARPSRRAAAGSSQPARVPTPESESRCSVNHSSSVTPRLGSASRRVG
jgi:hypothetical protein